MFLLYLSGKIEILEGASNKINKNAVQIGINQHVMEKLVGRQQHLKVLGTERGAWAWLYALGIVARNHRKIWKRHEKKQENKLRGSRCDD